MIFSRTLFLLALSLFLFGPVLARGESAEETSARAGKVLALRKRLDVEKDPDQWVRIARALHVYYLRREIYGEALALDRRIHKRLRSGLSASLLAQTLMAKGDNAEAARILADLPDEQQGMGTRATRVIALARTGRNDEALKAARRVSLPEHLCPGKAFLLARMNAALGANEEAARLLKKAFAAAPGSRLATFKQSARRCPEFKALFHDEKYAWVLQVQAENAQPDHDHDHGHGPGGHCVGCPCQDRIQDIPTKDQPEPGVKIAN